MSIDISFGQQIRWRQGGVIVSGRVAFVDAPIIRVVADDASEQEWQWIDIGDVLDSAEIPGQIDIFEAGA